RRRLADASRHVERGRRPPAALVARADRGRQIGLVDAEDGAELDDPRPVPASRRGCPQVLEIDEMEPRQPTLRLEAAQLAQRVEEPQRRLLLAREEQQLDLAIGAVE